MKVGYVEIKESWFILIRIGADESFWVETSVPTAFIEEYAAISAWVTMDLSMLPAMQEAVMQEATMREATMQEATMREAVMREAVMREAAM